MRPVVDAYCDAHSVSTLFMADGSCFVTQGCRDRPSLGIQTLARRAAVHLVQPPKAGRLPSSFTLPVQDSRRFNLARGDASAFHRRADFHRPVSMPTSVRH